MHLKHSIKCISNLKTESNLFDKERYINSMLEQSPMAIIVYLEFLSYLTSMMSNISTIVDEMSSDMKIHHTSIPHKQ